MVRRSKRFLALILTLTLLIALGVAPGTAGAASQPAPVTITVLGTSDLHGNIYPIDYFTDKPADVGLAKIATLVKGARAANPNTILVDSGDTLQGTPLIYYHNKINNTTTDPMMLVMSSLGYDSMTLGNHEFNFGLKVLEKARSEAKFPFLSANTYKADGTNAFTPYVVKTVGGVKVGILGLTTMAIPTWENPENYAGLTFKSLPEEGKKWVATLKNQEKVDVIVAAVHSGLEKDPTTGKPYEGQTPNENQVYELAMQNPEIDVIVAGHAHSEIPMVDQGAKPKGGDLLTAPIVNGVLIMEPRRWGERLGKIDLTLEPTGDSAKPWRMKTKTAANLTTKDVVADQTVLDLVKPYHDETQAWLSSPIGTATGDFPGGEDLRLKDTALVDLINKVQMHYAGADLSVAAAFTTDPQILKGPVTVRQMFSIYIYDNTLYAIEVTGQQIKEALEHSAKFYNTYDFGATDTPIVNPNIRGYNYDMLAGASYKIDITKPIGQRIYDLTYKGQPMDMNAKFRLAVNNYRVNGGGGYSMFKGAPVLYKSSDEIRNLMAEYVKMKGTIAPDVDNNWSLVPDYLFDANKEKIDLLVRQGILNPNPHPVFYPTGKMIASDYMVHLARAFNLKPIEVGEDGKGGPNDWIEPRGLAKKNPAVLDAPISREQALVLIVKALTFGKELPEIDRSKLEQYPDYGQIAPWARKYMAFALDRALIAPDAGGKLNPKAEITVSEAFALLADARFPQVTLLSTNDFHGAVKRDQKDRKTGKDWGGSSVVAAYINKARAANPAGTVVVDAGDMMQGTAVSNMLRGKPVIDVMNRIGYDAAALGNHEFDWTVDLLKERMAEAKFPFLAANIYDKATGERVSWAEPYTILERRGLKVALIGVTTPETAFKTLPANVADIEFRDPAPVVNDLAKELGARGVNLVLVVGHIGGAVGKDGAITGPLADLANAVTGVDAIVGGHSHTLMAGKVKGIPVIQGYYSGRSLAKANLVFDVLAGKIVESAPSTTYTFAADVTPVKEIQDAVDEYDARLAPIMNQVIGKTAVGLTRDYNAESNVGDLVADIIRARGGADFAFQNAGGLRVDIPAGDITVGKIYELMPFDNTIVTMKLTGAQVKEILEVGASGTIGMVQVSGLKFKYDSTLPEKSRVTEITLPDGTALDLTKVYTAATNDFMATGGDGYVAFKSGKGTVDTALLVRDAINDHIKAQTAAGKNIDPQVGGRVIKVK